MSDVFVRLPRAQYIYYTCKFSRLQRRRQNRAGKEGGGARGARDGPRAGGPVLASSPTAGGGGLRHRRTRHRWTAFRGLEPLRLLDSGTHRGSRPSSRARTASPQPCRRGGEGGLPGAGGGAGRGCWSWSSRRSRACGTSASPSPMPRWTRRPPPPRQRKPPRQQPPRRRR